MCVSDEELRPCPYPDRAQQTLVQVCRRELGAPNRQTTTHVRRVCSNLSIANVVPIDFDTHFLVLPPLISKLPSGVHFHGYFVTEVREPEGQGGRAGLVMIGFGPEDRAAALNLSPAGDLTEAAANLFEYLRRADATGRPIAVSPIPMHGLGIAINDRLTRAAHPR